jgi:type II secretory pathway pseudopilin PulG
VTARDRIVIVVVLAAAALAGFWFVGLAPKRKEAADLRTQIDAAQRQLSAAEQSASQARHAKASYNNDYAEVASLGKAVPKSDALPSLLYQLQSTARDARIDFKSLRLSSTGQAPAATPAAATASVAKSTGSSSSTPAGSTSTAAPATQAASSALPPGATVGSAGFPTMPFSFVFNGTFFDMERFLHDVQRFVRVDGQNVDVRGRLLSVDGFALTAGPGGFPSVKATISATAYLRGDDDAATPGSTSPGSTGNPAASTATAAPSATASAVAR